EEAWPRYVALVEVVCQYIGLLGLASQCRLGKSELPGDARAIVHAMQRGQLEPTDWLDLAAAVTKPFTRMRDAFPLPELVDVCHRRDLADRTIADSIRSLLDTIDTFTQRKVDRAELAGLLDAIGRAFG